MIYGYRMKNVQLNLKADQLELVRSLDAARRQANALDGYFAREHGGAYGAIKKALLTTLTCAIVDAAGPMYFGDAQKIADRLYEEVMDNGESVEYQIELWNTGRIWAE